MKSWFYTSAILDGEECTEIDVEYHRRRARQERLAALRTTCPVAAARHDQLAACHESLALLND